MRTFNVVILCWQKGYPNGIPKQPMDQCFVSSNWDFIFDPGRSGDVNVFRIRSDGKKNPMMQLLVAESRGREQVIIRMMLTHTDSWN